jgi:hypothetical protein
LKGNTADIMKNTELALVAESPPNPNVIFGARLERLGPGDGVPAYRCLPITDARRDRIVGSAASYPVDRPECASADGWIDLQKRHAAGRIPGKEWGDPGLRLKCNVLIGTWFEDRLAWRIGAGGAGDKRQGGEDSEHACATPGDVSRA